MRSAARVEPLDSFEQDVPTTSEDVAALEFARTQNAMDPHEFLAFHLLFEDRFPPTRDIPPFHEPFTL
jgi:hypothetical protein